MKIFGARSLLSGLFLTIVLAIVFRGVGSRAQSPRAAMAEQAASSKALVQQYCTMCHSDQLKTAGFSLEGRDFTNIGSDPDLWEKVLGRLAPERCPRSYAQTRSGGAERFHELP